MNIQKQFLRRCAFFLCTGLQILTAQQFSGNAISRLDPKTGVESLVSVYSHMLAASGFDPQRNDWYCETKGGRRFYWHNGCLLFQETPTAKKYKPYISYLYPKNVPDPAAITPDVISYLKSDGFRNGRENQGNIDQTFYAILYGGSASRGMTRAVIEENNRKIMFLGHQVTVNKLLVAPLKKVEQEIKAAAETDRNVKTFISTLHSVGGYNWRSIADSGSISNHSWGMAIDFLPRNWGKEIIYWFWESNRNEDWMLVPVANRWSPPAAVIAAFENNGFIWGGKWLVWDNMHFEYRPELHEINRRLAAADVPR